MPSKGSSTSLGFTHRPQVVPFYGLFLESYKVIPKRNYLGAYGFIGVPLMVFLDHSDPDPALLFCLFRTVKSLVGSRLTPFFWLTGLRSHNSDQPGEVHGAKSA